MGSNEELFYELIAGAKGLLRNKREFFFAIAGIFTLLTLTFGATVFVLFLCQILLNTLRWIS